MDPLSLLLNPNYWAVIETSGTGGIPGAEIYEYLNQLKVTEDYQVHPMTLYNDQVRDLIINKLGVDAQANSYRVKDSIVINFVDRSHLLAFVLKFRDILLIWRKD